MSRYLKVRHFFSYKIYCLIFLIQFQFNSTGWRLAIGYRLFTMWKGVFVIRGWYSGVRRNKRLSTTDNFLTSNAYAFIEINAHGLINIISSTRYKYNPDSFLAPLFRSQPCESFDRFVLCPSHLNTFFKQSESKKKRQYLNIEKESKSVLKMTQTWIVKLNLLY